MKKLLFDTIINGPGGYKRVTVKGYATMIESIPVNVYKDQRGIWWIVAADCGSAIGYSYETRKNALKHAAANLERITPAMWEKAREIWKKAGNND